MDVYNEFLNLAPDSGRTQKFQNPNLSAIDTPINQFSFAQNTVIQTPEKIMVQNTIATINDLLTEYCNKEDEEDNPLIGTLENATQKIISGLNDLKTKCKKQKKPSKKIEKENKTPSMPITPKQQICKKKASTKSSVPPLYKRVGQIVETRNNWIVEQQKKKQFNEVLLIEKTTYQPKIKIQQQTTEQFIESQREWLQRKNEQLLAQKLEQEKKTLEHLTFKPKLCQKSVMMFRSQQKVENRLMEQYYTSCGDKLVQ